MATPLDPIYVAFQHAVAGRYSVERELGRGGMGIVYLAREVDLDRPVAIKLLPPERATDAKLREQFLREARTAAGLSHPNVIAIHAVDEAQGFVFYAMAFIEGETLAQRVRTRGPLPPSEATRVLRDIAWALGHAHERGVIHRDVKPENILLEQGTGRVIVTDFGIAGIAGAAGSTTDVTGTPEFMSPEQVLGKPADARSDLYSLGTTAFFVLSGRLPFEAPSPAAQLGLRVSNDAPSLSTIERTIPRRIARVIDRCLAKDPAARPASAGELAEELSVAMEQRREAPVALRSWVKLTARFNGPGSIPFVLSMPMAVALASSEWGDIGAYSAAAIGAAAALTAFVAAARRLLKTGFTHGDLAPAFRAELEQAREERALDSGRAHGKSIVERVAWAVAGLGAVTATGTFLPILLGRVPLRDLNEDLLVGSILAAVAASTVALAGMQRRRDVDTEFWGSIWTGRFGRFVCALARLTIRSRSLPTAMTHRATELAIGMAAEQLYDDLPKATREELGDLPALIRRLERTAQALRRRSEDLREIGGHGTRTARTAGEPLAVEVVADKESDAADALREEAVSVRRKLADVVAALETVRLNLLRLHAGALTTQAFTTDLALASLLQDNVDHALEGYEEAGDVLTPT